MGAPRLRRFRRPYFLRKGTPVLRFGTPVEVGQAPGARRTIGETKAASRCSEIHCAEESVRIARDYTQKEGLKCQILLRILLKRCGELPSALSPRRDGNQNRRRWVAASPRLLSNILVRFPACTFSTSP